MKSFLYVAGGLALCMGAVYFSIGKEAVEALAVLGSVLAGIWLVVYGLAI